MSDVATTTATLHEHGYSPSVGYWLRPDGLSFVSEPDALAEVAAALADQRKANA